MARRRKGTSYVRREPERETYDYVLIVCEGEKTEPIYFEGLIQHQRLSSANINVTPAKGSDALSVVQFAEALYKKHQYDYVFCVFDRDSHKKWSEALTLLEHYSGVMFGIVSWPCFEFWFLLHYRFTSSGFDSSGNSSPCDKAIKALKNHIPGYVKAYPAIYLDLLDKLETAKANAKRLVKDNRKTGSKNPATNVHKLVSYLHVLKTPKKTGKHIEVMFECDI